MATTTAKAKAAPGFHFKVPADKKGTAFLDAVRANINRDTYKVRMLPCGPRKNGSYTTKRENATAFRIYIDAKPNSFEAQQRREMYARACRAEETSKSFGTEILVLNRKLDESHKHGMNLVNLNDELIDKLETTMAALKEVRAARDKHIDTISRLTDQLESLSQEYTRTRNTWVNPHHPLSFYYSAWCKALRATIARAFEGWRAAG